MWHLSDRIMYSAGNLSGLLLTASFIRLVSTLYNSATSESKMTGVFRKVIILFSTCSKPMIFMAHNIIKLFAFTIYDFFSINQSGFATKSGYMIMGTGQLSENKVIVSPEDVAHLLPMSVTSCMVFPRETVSSCVEIFKSLYARKRIIAITGTGQLCAHLPRHHGL